MKKSKQLPEQEWSDVDRVKAVGFDMEESTKDLFFILENLQADMDKIKTALKNKNIID
jgi:hypothetical protein